MTITNYMNNDKSAIEQKVYLYRDATQIQRVCYSPLEHEVMDDYTMTWEVKTRADRVFNSIYCDLPLVIKTREEDFDEISDYYQDPLSRPCTHISRQEFIDRSYALSFVEILRNKWFFRTLTVPSTVQLEPSFYYSENTYQAVNDMWATDETPILDLLERDLIVPMPIRSDKITGWTIADTDPGFKTLLSEENQGLTPHIDLNAEDEGFEDERRRPCIRSYWPDEFDSEEEEDSEDDQPVRYGCIPHNSDSESGSEERYPGAQPKIRKWKIDPEDPDCQIQDSDYDEPEEEEEVTVRYGTIPDEECIPIVEVPINIHVAIPQMNFMSAFPSSDERKGWKELVEKLVCSLDSTNITANNVVEMAGIATVQVHSINETFKEMVSKLPDDEFKNSLKGLMNKMNDTVEQVNSISAGVGKVFTPHLDQQIKTNIGFIDDAIKELGDGSIFLFFTTLLMHVRMNNIFTFASVVSVAITMYLQGKHKAWIMSQLGVLLLLFPKTTFDMRTKHQKYEYPTTHTSWNVTTDVFRDEDCDDDEIIIEQRGNTTIHHPPIKVVPQMMSEDELSGTFGVFTTMFLAFFAKGEKVSDKMMHFFSNFKRVGGGIDEFGKLLKNMLEWLATRLRNLYVGSSDLPSVRFFKTHNTEYELYTAEVRKFCKGFNDKSIVANHSTLMDLASLITVGEALRQKMPRDPVSRDIAKMLESDLTSLKNIRTQFERVNITTTGFRQEPAVLGFFGGPGTGKSKCVLEASFAAVARDLPTEAVKDFVRSPATRIFNRAAENVYWDGYLQQHIVVTFDDFGQAKDVAGTPDNEYMNFIRAANGFEYNLHTAALESKGKATFGAPFVVFSTNLTKMDPNSIINNKAITRRMDLKYVVIPRDEYCTPETKGLGYMERKLDSTALPPLWVVNAKGEKFYTTDFKTEHQWFIPCDVDEKGITVGIGAHQTWDEVIANWFEISRKKEAQYLQNVKSFNENFVKYRRKYAKIMSREKEEEMLADIFEQEEIPNYLADVIKDDKDWSDEIAYAQAIDTVSTASSEFEFYSTTEFIFSDLHKMDPETSDIILREWFKNHKKEYNMVLPFQLTGVSTSDLVEMTGMTEQEIFSSINEFIFVWKNRCIRPKRRLKRWFSRFDEWMQEKFPFMRMIANADFLALIVVVPLTITLLTKFVLSVMNYFFPGCTNEPQSMNHGDKMKVNKEFAKHYKNGTMKQHISNMQLKAHPQMGSDINGVNLLRKLSQKYVWQLYVMNDIGEWSFKASVLHLGGSDVLLPNHYLGSFFHNMMLDPAEANSKLRFTRLSNRNALIVHECTKADMIAAQSTGSLAKEKDLVICRITGFPEAKSILPYIVTNEGLSRDRDMMEAGLFGQKASMFFNARWRDTPLKVHQEAWDVDWLVREYYEYKAHTAEGDCGAIFAKMDSREPHRKIYGMHTAGTNQGGTGYASAFTMEEIQAELATLDDLGEAVPQSVETALKHITVLGKLSKQQTPSLCLKNNIIRSKIYDCTILAKTAPAVLKPVLRDGVLVSPMSNAYAKYDIEHKILTLEQKKILHDVATQIFDHQINVSTILKTPRVYTVREALYGTDDSEGLIGIAANTSAGWPLNLPGMKNVKKLLFPPKFGDSVFENNLRLFEEEIEEILKMYYDGIRPEWFYVDVLKIERRLFEKIHAVKTRMFSAGPFHLLVINRMFFGHFDTVYKQNRITNWSAVGVNPYSYEWEAIAKHLCKFDPTGEAQVGAGDYSSFDCTHNPYIHDIIVDRINNYYYSNATPRDQLVRTMLFKEISNSKHIVGNNVVQWHGSMPSGNALTIDVNNLYNSIAFGYCYCRILQDFPHIQLSYDDFCYNVVLILTGDDNAFSVHPELREFMNEITLPKYMAELGLIYTTELKQTATNKFRRLEEISFLKRTWVKDPYACRYIAPLELDVVLEICYWTKNNADWLSISADNVIATLNELSLHPKEIWDLYAPKIIAASQREYPGVQFSSPITKPWHKRREMTLNLISFF